MGFIDNQRIVLPQHPVALHLCQQNTVGHHLDGSAVRHLVVETDLVAHSFTQGCIQLLGNTLGYGACRQPPRLSMADTR